MDTFMKICGDCKQILAFSYFSKDKSSFDGLQRVCKNCHKQYRLRVAGSISIQRKKYRLDNKEKISQIKAKYYQRNRNKILQKYEAKKDEINKRHRQWYQENITEQRRKSREYYHNNKERARIYENNKRKEDINFKLVKLLRNRLNDALKNDYKSGSAIRNLCCSIPELKQWLEQQLEAGWTWENHGKVWHIDHIIPLSKSKNNIKKACHWFNLRPLAAKENISRGNRI